MPGDSISKASVKDVGRFLAVFTPSENGRHQNCH